MDTSFEVIIVGAGPAGWSASIFLSRAGVKTLVIGKDEESGLSYAADVRNFPGFPDGISGRTLLDNMIEQSVHEGVIYEHDEVTHIEEREGLIFVKTASLKQFSAKKLILAHGANYIKANIPGEKEYRNKGIYYCVTCDGPLYKNKNTLVLGNGNLAAEEAVELAAYAKSVKIVSNNPEINFSVGYADLLSSKNIEIIKARAKEIKGGEFAATLVLGNDMNLPFEGLFIALGTASSLDFARQLGLEIEGDFIKINQGMLTNNENIYACGMARGGINQVTKSVGEGTTAAINIIKSLKGLPNYIDHT